MYRAGAAGGVDNKFLIPHTPQTYADVGAILEQAGLDATGTNMGVLEAISSASDGDWGDDHEGCGLRMLPGMELDAPQDLAGAMARLQQQNVTIMDLKEANDHLSSKLQHAEDNCNALESEVMKLRRKLKEAGFPEPGSSVEHEGAGDCEEKFVEDAREFQDMQGVDQSQHQVAAAGLTAAAVAQSLQQDHVSAQHGQYSCSASPQLA
jgi:hypothetical protein